LSGKRKGRHSVQLPKGNFVERYKEADFGSVSEIAFQQFKLINNRLEIVNSSVPHTGILLNGAS
jgi:hypothetical protein